MRFFIFCATTLACFSNELLANEFNPDISLVLDGKYARYDTALTPPGFQAGGESSIPEDGFSLGHSELIMSSNIDNRFYGQLSAALEDHEETTLEIEEAFIETFGPEGTTLKFGEFLSGIGYLNSRHLHSHNFADTPFIYSTMLGGHMSDRGIQARWLAPLDHLAEFGVEVLSGDAFPGGETKGSDNARSFFANFGNDLSTSASWKFGAFRYETDFITRESDSHAHGSDAHGEEAGHTEAQAGITLHTGDVTLTGLNLVYKWAPNGNPAERNLVFQYELFRRQETAGLEFIEDTASFAADYDGEQRGYYASAVYQFYPKWQAGLRYDQLEADNRISNITESGVDEDEFTEETGFLLDRETDRSTVMIDYSNTEFSRIRLQYSRTNTPLTNGGEQTEGLWMVQYVMSMGSHGAHAF